MRNCWENVIAEKAISEGLIGGDSRIILGGPRLDSADLAQLGVKLARLLELICDIPNRFFGGQLDLMAKALRFPEKDLQVFRNFSEELKVNVLYRADLVRNGGGWRVHELNIGSNVTSGLLYGSLPLRVGLHQEFDVLKGWCDGIRALSRDCGSFAFVSDRDYIEVLRKPMEELAEEIRTKVCENVFILAHDEVEIGPDGNLYVRGGEKIDFIYRLFNEHNVAKRPEEYAAIAAARSTGRIICPMGPAYSLIGNKGIFALLWNLFSGTNGLSMEEKLLLKELVPRTYWVESETYDFIKENKNNLVLKPINYFQCFNVYAGAEMTEDKWDSKISEIIRNDVVPFVVQEYAGAEVANIKIYQKAKVFEEISQVSWGIYMFGDRLLGGIIRGKPANKSVIYWTGEPVSAAGPLPV